MSVWGRLLSSLGLGYRQCRGCFEYAPTHHFEITEQLLEGDDRKPYSWRVTATHIDCGKSVLTYKKWQDPSH